MTAVWLIAGPVRERKGDIMWRAGARGAAIDAGSMIHSMHQNRTCIRMVTAGTQSGVSDRYFCL